MRQHGGRASTISIPPPGRPGSAEEEPENDTGVAQAKKAPVADQHHAAEHVGGGHARGQPPRGQRATR